VQKLRDRDVEYIARRLPKPVRELLKDRPDVFIAGGFIRACIASEDVNDIDLFAPSKDVANLVAMKLANGGPLIATENAYTTEIDGVSVQVIHRWTFANPAECMASFDFSIACAAVWFSDVTNDWNGKRFWCSLAHDDYYADLAGKRLVYLSPQRNEDAGGSILRVLKFYQRGYRIPLDSLGAVIARLVKGIDFARLKDFGDNESWIANVVTGLLVEVDPNITVREAMNQD